MSMDALKDYRKILVTGATGRLGSNLVKRLLAEGIEVRSFLLPDHPAERTLDGLDTEKCYGDIRDEVAVEEAMEGVDAVVHCAAVMGEPRGGLTTHSFFDINVRGAFNVLNEAARRRGQIKKVVHLSSTTAYDVWTTGPVIREDAPLRPLKLYGTTKAAGETIARCVEFQSGVPVVILRPNFIMACDEVLNGFRAGVVMGALKRAANDPRCTLYAEGAGEPWRLVEQAVESPQQRVIPRGPGGEPWTWHVTDVRDAVQAIALALAREEANGRTFNVAGPKPARWDEVVPYLCEKLGEEYAEVAIPNLWRFELDLTAAKKYLGYAPEFTVERMIDDAVRFRRGEDIGVIPPAIAH